MTGGGLAAHVWLATGVFLVASAAGAAASATASQQAIAYIELAPNPVTGAPWVTTYGHHFCSDPACSSVTITVAGQTVAEGVVVAMDGTFQQQFQVTTPPGQHRVEATQVGADGEVVVAAETLQVAARDFAIDTSSPRPAPGTPAPDVTGGDAPSAPDRDVDTGGATAEATAADSTAPAARTDADDGSMRGWWWIIPAVVALAAVAAWLRRGRGRGEPR